tara:strand:- start:8537 stop:8785 length:249 start_codon:yes stop_codon:yes gene_type:complete
MSWSLEFDGVDDFSYATSIYEPFNGNELLMLGFPNDAAYQSKSSGEWVSLSISFTSYVKKGKKGRFGLRSVKIVKHTKKNLF